MTLLELAKRCGKTIQAIAQAIETEFKDTLSLSSNTHVPDRYISTIIKKFLGSDTFLQSETKGTKGKSSRPSKSTKKHTEEKPQIPKSRKSKERSEQRSSKVSMKGDKDLKATGNSLSGMSLLKYLKGAVNKAILSGSIVNYDKIRDVYFVEVLGFKSLMYSSEVDPDVLLNPGDTIEVVPIKVDGRNAVEYMTVSMKRVRGIVKNMQPRQPNKRQLELEFEQLEIGSQIKGYVSRVEENYVIVDFNGLRGIIHKNDLFWSNIHKINAYIIKGQPIIVKVLSKETDEKGNFYIRLSHKECISNIWDNIDLQIGETVECSVIEVVENGAILSICLGLEGFIHKNDMTHYEYIVYRNWRLSDGYEEVCVKSFNAASCSLRFSTKQFRDDNWWEEVCKEFKIGSIQIGTIFDKDESGVWVEFDNMLETYVPNRELYWKNTRNNQKFEIGETVNVLITEINTNKKSIRASIKSLTPDPWMLVNENLKGQIIDVKIIGIVEGKFLIVETLDNFRLHGKIKFSEISWQFSSIELPISMIPAIGEIISARIVVLSKDLRRLDLSIRQQHPDPWTELEPGVPVRGKLGKVIHSGKIEVSLENGLNATTIENDLLSMEDEYIDFKVTECSRQTKNIEVSHSQLLYDRMNEGVIRKFFGM